MAKKKSRDSDKEGGILKELDVRPVIRISTEMKPGCSVKAR